MLKKGIVKITFVLVCILALIMPYTSTVLAAALSQEDMSAELQVLLMHEGGQESSGTLTDEQKEVYDTKPYGYQIGDTRIYKIISKADYSYTNIFYCLNANKSFPGVTNTGLKSLEYLNVGDFKDSTDSDVRALHLSTGITENSELWTKNYRSLLWLSDNMYLSKQAPEQKDDFLAKAFANYDEYTLDVVKGMLTDDDIDVVQQYAIWYFTNNDTEKFNVTTLPAVTLTKINGDGTTTEGSYNNITGSAIRQSLANHLYQYLIESARTAENNEVTYPHLVELNQSEYAEKLQRENYYIIGPIKMASGTAVSTQYTIKLLDQENNEIARNNYEIYIEGESNFSNKNINEIFDKQYYIYLPESNKTITNLNVVLEYSSYETKASLWENKTTNEEGIEVYQPLVLLTRGNTPHKATASAVINRDTADLALRKYIVKVNNKTVNRRPTVNISALKNGTSKTAEYKHQKDPVKVSAGDTVVYEIRVYNEADINANGVVIIDALPKGLELAENSTINTKYGWTKLTEGNNVTRYSSEYLKNTTIEKFNKETSTELNSAYVQIECKVSNNNTAAKVLTNIAEILNDNIDDRDSTPGNNDYTKNDYDSSNYTGDNNNKSDLTDKNYYYKGREDDDDFEKIEIEGKTFDLSLKKFISKVNKNAPSPSREPVVDVTKLKNKTNTNATYNTVKTPLVVQKGDIVTYTLRVYNEGDLSGYAEEVSDYLPEGLGFLVSHTTNVDNYWAIPDNCKTVKLSTIENAKDNLSLEDFTGVTNLNDVDVVVGSVKLTSSKLKSSDTDTKNLIKGFNRETANALDYKDIQITCVVLADKVENNNFKNIAEIVKDSDESRKEIIDRDSITNTVVPDNYPGEDENQDDNDYEDLTIDPKVFDLSLQKIITEVNGKAVTGREPQITINSDGKVQFAKTAPALQVENNDIITYSIRVYNEGNVSGYAKEIADNLPNGLEFLKDNETNKKYGWKLYDKNGNETTDLAQAVKVKTDYLSKEKSTARNDDSLIPGFNGKNLYYQEVKIAFKVIESKLTGTTARTIKNVAEITDDQDENGNPITDIDSKPNNNKDGEDDIDNEKVYVKYFDLSLKKDLVKIIVTENGTTKEISVSSTDGLQKVEVHRKKINSTTVKFVYNITVKNEGEIAGYATEIKDYIPEGLEFIEAENKQWTKSSNNTITTSALAKTKIEPGKSVSVQLVLKWINGDNNFGLKVNTAEISADKNDSNTKDIDSTPNNKVAGEDDIDTAEVVLGISTGTAPTYIGLTTTVLAIMTTGIILIKKYVLI